MALKYNGENHITRSTGFTLAVTSSGFTVGTAAFQAITLVVDPTAATFWGNIANSVTGALPNASELAALYDSMRIDKIEVTWSSTVQASGSTTTPVSAPKFIVCTDVNGSTSGTSNAAINQQNPKEYFSIDGSSNKYTYRPKFQRLVYYTSLVSSYEPAVGFVNSDTAIPHYGMQIGIANVPTNCNVDFQVKYYMTLKHVK